MNNWKRIGFTGFCMIGVVSFVVIVLLALSITSANGADNGDPKIDVEKCKWSGYLACYEPVLYEQNKLIIQQNRDILKNQETIKCYILKKASHGYYTLWDNSGNSEDKLIKMCGK